MNADRDGLHRDVSRLMRASAWREADARCRTLNAAHRAFAPGWILASLIAQQLQEPERALQLAERAAQAAPSDPAVLLRRAQCLDGLRHRPEALRAAEAAERAAENNPPARWCAATSVSSRQRKSTTIAS